MHRRQFLKATATGVIAAAAGAGPVRSARGQATKEVVYGGFGGSFQDAVNKAWLEPFERETGVKVRVVTFDFGKLGTMVETKNVEWDLCDISGSSLGVGYAKNLFEPLDYKIIDPDGLAPSDRGEFAISYTKFGTILAWSTRKYSGANVPTGWADYWDQKKFPGPRAMWKVPYNTLEYALMADGVDKDKLYPLDVDRAFRKLDQLKPHVKVWWTSGQQPIQLLADGEVEMANAFNGRLAVAKRDGAKLDFTFNQGVLASTWFIVPRGAPNRENAMRLIAYILKPQVSARLTDLIPSSPSNAKAYQFIKPDVAAQQVAAPQNAAKMANLDEAGYWAKHYADLKKRFDEWVVK